MQASLNISPSWSPFKEELPLPFFVLALDFEDNLSKFSKGFGFETLNLEVILERTVALDDSRSLAMCSCEVNGREKLGIGTILLSASMEKKRMEIIDAAKGEEEKLFADIGMSTRARLGTVDVKFLDNITMQLNKPTPDWAVSIEHWH